MPESSHTPRLDANHARSAHAALAPRFQRGCLLRPHAHCQPGTVSEAFGVGRRGWAAIGHKTPGQQWHRPRSHSGTMPILLYPAMQKQSTGAARFLGRHTRQVEKCWVSSFYARNLGQLVSYSRRRDVLRPEHSWREVTSRSGPRELDILGVAAVGLRMAGVDARIRRRPNASL
jgi:hypothetical protein